MLCHRETIPLPVTCSGPVRNFLARFVPDDCTTLLQAGLEFLRDFMVLHPPGRDLFLNIVAAYHMVTFFVVTSSSLEAVN